jgi:hypothetical protein
MTTSVNLLKDQWLMAAGYIFVAGLCSIAGILLCCVGIIATMPIMYIAQAIAYHRMVGGGSAYVQGASPYPRDPGTVANMPAGPESWPAQASDAPTPSASAEAPVIEDVPPVEDAEPTPPEDVPVVEDPPTDPEPPKA